MKGLAIIFSKEGAVLSNSSQVEDFETISQNGLVNIGTIKGTDTLYPNRGTAVYSTGVAGGANTYDAAYHVSNFAALDTTFFLRSSDYDTVDYERVRTVYLEPVEYTGTQMKLNARFEGDNSTVIGKEIVN